MTVLDIFVCFLGTSGTGPDHTDHCFLSPCSPCRPLFVPEPCQRRVKPVSGSLFSESLYFQFSPNRTIQSLHTLSPLDCRSHHQSSVVPLLIHSLRLLIYNNTNMSSFRRIYNHLQKHRRSHARSPLLSAETRSSRTMAFISIPECRECRLGLFCYNHVESCIPTSTSHGQPMASNTNEPAQAKPTSNTDIQQPKESTSAPNSGTFEKSQSDGEAQTTSNPTSNPRPSRDPNLPQIFVENVEIPYWIK